MWQVAVPIVRLVAAYWLVRNIYWSRYLTLVPFLVLESVIDGVYLLSHSSPLVSAWAQVLIIPMKLLIAVEVFYFTLIEVSRVRKLLCCAAMVVASFVCYLVLYKGTKSWGIESVFAFRQYLMIMLASALAALWIVRIRRPISENEEHFAFRTMMTLHALRTAISASFVHGGFGYMIFPFLASTHQSMNSFIRILQIVMWIVTAWWMARSFSSRVPAWMQRRHNFAACLPWLRERLTNLLWT